MKVMPITPSTEFTTQSFVLNLTIGNETKRCNMILNYMEKTDKWYCSLSNLQTGESYLTNVPVYCTYGEVGNDLWLPYLYKNIGMLFCFPRIAEPSSTDPSKNNFDEFILVWSDGNE